MTDRDLMLKIKTQWGAAIAEACKASSVPPAFLAALVANESGGDANANRREPAAMGAILEVIADFRSNYEGVFRDTFLGYVAPRELAPNAIQYTFRQSTGRLVYLATSWGLTQIMGWQELKRGKPSGTVQEPRGNLLFALELLARFAEANHLDVTKDFEAMFRCWNTGRPDGKTFDPQYVANGENRRVVYEFA